VAFVLAGAGCVPTNQYLEMRSKYQEEASRNRQLIEEIEQLRSAVGSIKSGAAAERIDADLARREAELWRRAGMWGAFKSKDIELVDGGRRVRLTALTFGSGSADLTERGRAALDEIAGQLRTKAGVQLVVEGHTDNDPIRNSPNKSNWELSGKRAAAVVDYLVKAGVVKGDNAMLTGHGEFKPIDAANKARNRRVELYYVQLDKAGEPMPVTRPAGVEDGPAGSPAYPRAIRPVSEGGTLK
jgi:chemotaxis protein MotB